MRFIVKLPSNAKYDYTNIFGLKHYHTKNFVYLKDRHGIIMSYSKKEFELRFNNNVNGSY